ncbi:HAUS augmin-like complex subunit 1 [Rhynchospora pubera]|uniref:HAUS augmin-like complex subunit 1 n=1 Tax=Rhynchospora pubera TaxID=906938 RepID=A0AAV8CHD6_9POAL|nr:HAUS augmin-like complex subunit 1 [Rhynchospora pubera]
MESMETLMASLDSHSSTSSAASDAARLVEVQSWLSSLFDQVNRQVPDLTLTRASIKHLHSLASLSQSRSRAAAIVAPDLRQKAAEYRAEAARIREILSSAGLGREHLSPSAMSSAQAVAEVANLVGIRDTETSSFVVANADLVLRKTEVAEKRINVQRESKMLLEYTRKAITKLAELKKLLSKFENEAALHEEQMYRWQKNLAMLDEKERQYNSQLGNYKQALLNRAGYTSDINHGVLMQMAEDKKDYEKKTKPILDTLRSYQDLPPDKTLAALAIEDKKRQYAAAEKYLEDVLGLCLNAPPL